MSEQGETKLKRAIQETLTAHHIHWERIQSGTLCVRDPKRGNTYWCACAHVGTPDLYSLDLSWLEVKLPGKELTDVQKKWHAKAARRGIAVHVVRSVADVVALIGCHRRERKDCEEWDRILP